MFQVGHTLGNVKTAEVRSGAFSLALISLIGFERFIQPENEASPAIYVERNKKWLPTIVEAIKEMPTLFVFGAGHLTGQDGVVRMLRDTG